MQQQGITDPYSDPKLMQQAQTEIDKANNRSALTNGRTPVPWADGWQARQAADEAARTAYNNTQASTVQPTNVSPGGGTPGVIGTTNNGTDPLQQPYVPTPAAPPAASTQSWRHNPDGTITNSGTGVTYKSDGTTVVTGARGPDGILIPPGGTHTTDQAIASWAAAHPASPGAGANTPGEAITPYLPSAGEIAAYGNGNGIINPPAAATTPGTVVPGPFTPGPATPAPSTTGATYGPRPVQGPLTTVGGGGVANMPMFNALYNNQQQRAFNSTPTFNFANQAASQPAPQMMDTSNLWANQAQAFKKGGTVPTPGALTRVIKHGF
jgi:hypothetical protein